MNLPKTEAELLQLGFAREAVTYMVTEICKVLALYPSPEKATVQLESTLPQIALSRFGTKQFLRFLKDIHPDAPYTSEVSYLQEERTGRMTPEERAENQRAIQAFELLRSVERPRWLESPLVYEALTVAHFRASRSAEGKAPPHPRFVSTPMGGQPKRK